MTWREAVSLTLMSSALYSLISGNPLSWVTILAAILGTAIWRFAKPLITVMYKNYQGETYHGHREDR